MLELGHPWVIADRYTRDWPKLQTGTVASLCDGSGRHLATALCDPRDRVVARVLDRKPIKLGPDWLRQRLLRAHALRLECIDQQLTNAFRLVNGEGDGLPGLTVDHYDRYLMIQLYCEGWRPHLPLVAEVLQQLVKAQGIYEKQRPRETRDLGHKQGKKLSRLLTGKSVAGKIQVRENGLNFLIDLEEGLNTGLFLDQRRNRADLMARVRGKRVLNLFSYTGAFSVAAAAAGADLVTSVDVSAGYLDWARENFRANRLDERRHEVIAGDCFDVLASLQKGRRSFDLILMDPPSFSTTATGRFTTRQGTSELVAAAFPLLKDGGLLISSSNHQKIDLAEYLKELRRGVLQAGGELRVIQNYGQPEDFPYPVTFPEGRYLKYVIGVKG